MSHRPRAVRQVFMCSLGVAPGNRPPPAGPLVIVDGLGDVSMDTILDMDMDVILSRNMAVAFLRWERACSPLRFLQPMEAYKKPHPPKFP